MTAVEYLVSCITKLEWDLLEKKIDCEEYGRIYRQNIEEAKEMEKQQKIEFGKKVADHWGMTEVPIEEIEKFLNTTYGSKGSDEQRIYGEHTITILEISDEEIYKQADKEFRHFEDEDKDIWIRACQWYREQLKKKQ